MFVKKETLAGKTQVTIIVSFLLVTKFKTPNQNWHSGEEPVVVPLTAVRNTAWTPLSFTLTIRSAL